MPINPEYARDILLENLNSEQREAVASPHRQLLVIAGAGSGKTEVMARRVAWWVAVDGVSKDKIVAFTFMNEAAEELKFRIRSWLERVTKDDEEPTLGGMYIGTIHGFCLKALRDFAPADYYMFDVLDDAGRISFIEQGWWNVLGLQPFRSSAERAGAVSGKFAAYELFRNGYDQLNEHGLLDVQLSSEPIPADVREERDWCMDSELLTPVGTDDLSERFGDSAARYYSYLRARRFFDFGTVQSELLKRLEADGVFRTRFEDCWSHLVVDEVQDINPVQDRIIRSIVRDNGHMTAVGDHRQAIYAFRGGRVDLMGSLYMEIEPAPDGRVVELPANYRSTERIIQIANEWSQTIQERGGMTNPDMAHGRESRIDQHDNHVALIRFVDRDDEASWIAESIDHLVRYVDGQGASHDVRDKERGISFGDVAILVRSGTDIRTYQNALQDRGIPAVVRGGPDLFSQPESLLVLSAFALASGVDSFMGNEDRQGSLPNRIRTTLNVDSRATEVIPAAVIELRQRGLTFSDDTAERLVRLSEAICRRNALDRGLRLREEEVFCADARRWLARGGAIRRVFPQKIFHWLLEEAGIADWGQNAYAETARFHIGQISKLIKGIETSGWTPPNSLKWQTIALMQWGSSRARSEAAPLLVSPDAVSITTIHSAKGLEFSAVFLADVNAQRFPSKLAKQQVSLPFDLDVVTNIDPARLADNDNYDDERRLLYVAMTRAERYLFVTCSGRRRSRFITELEPIFRNHGAVVNQGAVDIAPSLIYSPISVDTEASFATSFSDLRYYTECPQDFYMRVVMGFTPTIGQEFGYGRGVHNLLRAIHQNPAHWAALAGDRAGLNEAVIHLVDQGMFYLRYTTGVPLENLRRKAIAGVTEYVVRFAEELGTLEFEPEKEFETLIQEEQLLISGAIDVVRLDDPPRVTIVDFKSGDADEDTGSGLTHDLMAMQIGVYGLAAVHELEYEPQQGLVRYIGETNPDRMEITVDLTDDQLRYVRAQLVETARNIRDREFDHGPSEQIEGRCFGCDFKNICRRSQVRRS
ncbi:ATP-dependent DNA helicase [Desulfonatronum sp. SC1]|uniref:ATP-dependent DNA helicase n=1 Tax=Desulfonatronum sp. SC1 TaxID=2109626 RepID=UPI000D31D25A|nr:ATP-dependent DNA helicase [Desulfonatronum sp. SC1]PTN38966.1 ATP-dependent helicase [Desulfonatronum sp. SC1]